MQSIPADHGSVIDSARYRDIVVLIRRKEPPVMSEEISLEGPLELIDGNLTLQIPLSAGGDKLAPLARGIGEVQGDNLVVVIHPGMAERLRIGAGSLVFVDNLNGKFTITRSAKNDDPARQSNA
jgi:hypothetical protein